MQFPPMDFSRWTLRTLRMLDQTWRTIFPEPKKPERPPEPDRGRPDIW